MTDKPNGGPAFPRSGTDINVQSYPGMTLRDWFASQAIAGLTANGSIDIVMPDELASDAYFMADAMLKERDK